MRHIEKTRMDLNAARFFIGKTSISGNEITIAGDDAVHITASLRMKEGELITVCDGYGTDYECELTRVGRDEVRARIKQSRHNACEPGIDVILCQSLPKSDKFEYAVQKCVEAGINKIVPVVSAHTQFGGGLSGESRDRRVTRWRRISYEAAKQTGRGIVPEICDIRNFTDAVDECAKNVSDNPETALALIPYENEEKTSLRTALTEFRKRMGNAAMASCADGSVAFANARPKAGGRIKIFVFIGPEGGFSVDEIEYCVSRGVRPVTLGPRVLRTETAGLAALCQIMYEFDQ